ncbi:MAG: precorrin-2 C(20)-methyltransferase [Methanomethylophilus sp.]|nr:precorrin-2 C(20)-methyltransferase [Methanomethylophilus sp.]MDD4669046.1 precorrin-2 C(20)-methyltransferase [Methanomethylophilus sp.]
MKGKLYGIGVGPGDPGLLTVKAKMLLDKATVIAYPVKTKGGNGTALEIIRPLVDLSGKQIVELVFSMDPDLQVRRQCRRDNTDALCALLESGHDVAVISLGDVSVYSTYTYLDTEVRERGYETEVVPGIPSFCSGAALARLPLMIGEESLAVVSAADHNQDAATALDHADNVVVMKAFSFIGELVKLLNERRIPLAAATVMSNVGMPDEYIGPLDPDRQYGYFTTVLVKKGKGEK